MVNLHENYLKLQGWNWNKAREGHKIQNLRGHTLSPSPIKLVDNKPRLITCSSMQSIGKWGRAQPRLALWQDLKQGLRLLADRGWEQKPSTNVKGQGTQVVKKDEPVWSFTSKDYFGWGAGVRETNRMDSNQWGRVPFRVWGTLCNTRGPERTQSLCAQALRRGNHIHTASALPKPHQRQHCQGFVTMLKVIHLVLRVAGNFCYYIITSLNSGLQFTG